MKTYLFIVHSTVNHAFAINASDEFKAADKCRKLAADEVPGTVLDFSRSGNTTTVVLGSGVTSATAY